MQINDSRGALYNIRVNKVRKQSIIRPFTVREQSIIRPFTVTAQCYTDSNAKKGEQGSQR